ARVEQRVQQVDARIDELRDRINAELTARNLRQDSAVQALDVPTYMNLATALAEANRLGAIADGTIRVQGSRERGELALDFSWTRQMADGRFSLPDRTELMVKAYIYADERARGGRPVIQKDCGRDHAKRLDVLSVSCPVLDDDLALSFSREGVGRSLDFLAVSKACNQGASDRGEEHLQRARGLGHGCRIVVLAVLSRLAATMASIAGESVVLAN
ncbi:MAG: hypothetical protein ACRDHE_06210, partial [Ktedonobacterales bacterium]